MSTVQITIARADDVPQLNELIHRSAAVLSQNFYRDDQIAALNQYVFGVDTALLADQSYFVLKKADLMVACGGWSRRKTLYGGDQRRIGLPELLDPANDAAKIRAFFVHPDHARQGLGRLLLQHCEMCAREFGFKCVELMATLPGVPLYEVCGFNADETVSDMLPNGVSVNFVRMSKRL